MNPKMEYKLAEIAFSNGDRKGGVEILRRLAEAGHVTSQEELGIFYEQGILSPIIPKDLRRAHYWFSMAAENGGARGQFCLGQMLEYGAGVDRDPVAAFQNYRLAAGGGYPDAQLAHAASFLEGIGVQKDLDKAFQLLSQYSDEGNSLTQVALGKLTYNPAGSRENLWHAFNCFMNAAVRGNTEGSLLAIKLMLTHADIKTNWKVAFLHLVRAGAEGREGAEQMLRGAVIPQMNSKELDEAQESVRNFTPTGIGQPMFIFPMTEWFVQDRR